MQANNKKDTHTPEWLRSFEGCEHYTDQEAMEILQSLDVLAAIFLQPSNENTININKRTIVFLGEKDTNQKLAA